MNAFKSRNGNKRGNVRRQSQVHILNVKARSGTMTARRIVLLVRWIVVFCMVGGLAGGGVYGVKRGLNHFLWENPNYKLLTVHYQTDGTLSRETALKKAGITVGANIFSAKLGNIREALASLPQVLQVEVERTLPNQIAIRLNERKPVAWVAEKNSDSPSTLENAFLIDANGVLLKHAELLPEYLRLPTISGVPMSETGEGQTLNTPEIRAALALIESSHEIEPVEVRSIELSKGYCMQVTTSTRAQITFGIERIQQQLERLTKYLRYAEENRREIQTVNLMVQRNVPVTFMPVESRPAGEEKKTTSAEKLGAKPVVRPAKDPTKSSKPKSIEPEVRRAVPVSIRQEIKNG